MNINILNYLDYQEYLIDWYSESKQLDKKITYQMMADQAGIKSRAYLQKVFTGTKPLSLNSAPKIIQLFNLTQHEVDYFILLIHLKNAKTDSEKSHAMEKIDSLINPDALVLERNRFAYFKCWYHSAIREMVCHVHFDNNYQKMGRALTPGLTAREAHDSVKLLLALGLIEPTANGYTQTHSLVSANSSQEFVALRGHIKQMIDLGRQAVDRFTPKERHVVSITAGVSHQGYNKLNQTIIEFKQKVEAILKDEHTVEKACQLNIQLFPLSKDF